MLLVLSISSRSVTSNKFLSHFLMFYFVGNDIRLIFGIHLYLVQTHNLQLQSIIIRLFQLQVNTYPRGYGYLLYDAHCINSPFHVVLNDIGTDQTAPTKKSAEAIAQLLDYYAVYFNPMLR